MKPLNPDQIEMIRATYRRIGNRQQAAIYLGLDRTTIVRHTRDMDPVASHAKSDLSWQERAACQGYATDTFFPSGARDTECIDQAKRVCAGCPVTAACLEYAVRTGSEGVWGGRYMGYSGHRAGAEKAA